MNRRSRTHAVKTSRMPVPSALAQRSAVFALGALAAAAMGTVAHAQDSVGSVDAPGPKPSVWIERRVTVGQTLSTNGGLSTNARSEQTTEVTPGIRAVFNTPRVQGFIDYSLSALFYAQGTSGNQFRNALNANAKVNAWDNRAFIDLSGVVSNQAISAFGPQSANGRSDTNQSETLATPTTNCATACRPPTRIPPPGPTSPTSPSRSGWAAAPQARPWAGRSMPRRAPPTTAAAATPSPAAHRAV